HDHKFDPVSQREYYALAGILQNVPILSGFLGDSKAFSNWTRVPLPEDADELAQRKQIEEEHAGVTRVLERKLEEEQANLASLEAKHKAAKNEEKAALASELAAEQKKIRYLRQEVMDHTKANAPEPPNMFAAKATSTPTNARVTIRGNAYQLG